VHYQATGRRTALKYLSFLAASTAGKEFLASWLAPAEGPGAGHAHPLTMQTPDPRHAAPAPQFFSPQEYRSVEILTELIIPTDDQPGAKEAQVARYIDFVVFSAAEFQPQLQKDWVEGLALLEKLSQQKHGHAFSELSTAQQEALLTEMSLPEHDSRASHQGFAFYRRVKEMTVEGFYTSKIGLVDVLGYQGRTYLAEFPGCTHPEHQK
jgi:gluconate 2-dehydrogenase subunit 3-like protein